MCTVVPYAGLEKGRPERVCMRPLVILLQIKVPAERTVCKLTMTAVNDMNVVVTREVEVVLEPQR